MTAEQYAESKPYLMYASWRIRRCANHEDIVHDAMLKMLEISEREPVASAGGLLYCLTRRRALRLARQESRMCELDSSQPAPSCEPTIIWNVMLVAVKKALRWLNDREREIVERFYFSGEDHATISAALGISEHSFACTKSRALSKLRARLS